MRTLSNDELSRLDRNMSNPAYTGGIYHLDNCVTVTRYEILQSGEYDLVKGLVTRLNELLQIDDIVTDVMLWDHPAGSLVDDRLTTTGDTIRYLSDCSSSINAIGVINGLLGPNLKIVYRDPYFYVALRNSTSTIID